jgi:hypothetical protein
MRLVIKILAVVFVGVGLLLLGWLATLLLSVFGGLGLSFEILPFFVVVSAVEWISPRRHDRIHKGNCSCPACRRKAKFEKDKKDKFLPMCDVPLFCKVFPEGLVGSCGFRWNGYCEVFEDSCVRWNELGDKKDYGVGKPNPFK